MSLRRIAVLFGRELRYGARSFIVIFALITPLVLSLAISLVFGNLFSDRPRLGIVDPGTSAVARVLAANEALSSRPFSSEAALREAVEAGVVDVGVVLPAGLDQALQAGDLIPLTAYVWGESLARHRQILAIGLASALREVTGLTSPVEIASIILGDENALPLADRLLPLVALMALIIGGVMVPATSLVEEKQKRTLTAVTTTSARLEEVLVSKGLLGALLSIVVGAATLALNRLFGPEPALLLLVLVLSGILAAAFGLLLGFFAKDITSLFAIIKGIGILLYAPAFLYLFPQVPQWIGRLFPTYYMINPLVEITQNGAGWTEVALELAVLAGLIVATAVVLALLARRTRRKLGE